ncbi:MarR family winged helix-turn-helix transcriptional regulator [Parablautia muri]|uniref:MarR family transcriptional regulator n=1 Tax=Parablautia muri TaxID=2320879 RepID=A0A9X5BG60_9FIRM|nr:MarR family transcriptional regulator [Parablautia muri]NBJ93171.1 MarR family transcriptional regulator [Parablautia muri]
MERDMQHQIINLFRQVDQSFKRVADKRVTDTGLYRSQHRMLMILGKHPDCSQTELAEMLDISPAAVAVTLKKLEKAGYISRQCNVEDNRINHVIMTEKGKKAIDISLVYFKEIENALLMGFSKEEMELLEGFFLRIIKNGEIYYQNL